MAVRRLGAFIGLAVLLSACTEVQQATDRASICVDALQIAGFTPDASNPQQALQDAHDAAAKLNSLAGETPDQALKQTLSDMAGTIGEFDPSDAAGWVTRKGQQLDALRQACT